MILGISPQTVKKHLEHIYQKLGVETRTAAAMLVLVALAEKNISGHNNPRPFGSLLTSV